MFMLKSAGSLFHATFFYFIHIIKMLHEYADVFKVVYPCYGMINQ